jgi:hypothetical protein
MLMITQHCFFASWLNPSKPGVKTFLQSFAAIHLPPEPALHQGHGYAFVIRSQ